jgi:hypothetical protein
MKTLILIAVETETQEQGEFVRREAVRLLGNLLREKRYVLDVQAEALAAGSIAADLADEIIRLRTVLDLRIKERP